MKKVVSAVLNTAEIVGKTVVSTIPVGGALITAVYDTVKGGCLQKRQENWENTIEKRLSKIEKDIAEVGRNPLFTTALIKTTQLAMMTSDNNKISYLAEALVHSLDENLDETRMIIYLNLLDKYTATHIQLLERYYRGYVDEPKDDDILVKVFNDLYNDGLVYNTNDAKNECHLTNLGVEFYEFVRCEIV